MAKRSKWLINEMNKGAKRHTSSGLIVWPDGRTSNHITGFRGGYVTVRDCEGKIWLLHRLMAECFIPNPENKPVVNHIDGDKSNYRLDNLEWATHGENQLHAYRVGLKKYVPKAKFTRRQILYIRRSETPFFKLAERYKVSDRVIYNIRYLKTHKNV